MRPILLLSLVLAAVPSSAEEAGIDPLGDLLETERSFARHCSQNGVAASFPRFAAEGAVVFGPEPVDLADWLEKYPAPESPLDWRPLLAGVARSGDLGWTTGPWSMAAGSDGGTIHGTYLTVWRLQADGTWKWEIDIGVRHPRQEEEPDELTVAEPGGAPPETKGDLEATRTRLFMVDRLLGIASEKQGRARAYQSYGDADLRLYRQGQPPVVGLEASLEVLGKTDIKENWKTQGGGISSGADLGYTYGAVQLVKGPRGSRSVSGHYLRLWRRAENGIWKLLVDVELPAPAA